MYVILSFVVNKKGKIDEQKTPAKYSSSFGIRPISIQVSSNRPNTAVDIYSIVTGETRLYVISPLGSGGSKCDVLNIYNNSTTN